jgi:hypothetical protein
MIKQNPFSLYDFLGYFIPGALLIYSFIALGYINDTDIPIIKNITDDANNTGVDKIFFFIIISYALGHLTNFISSITIEKYAIWKYDYPSKFLLNLDKTDYWKENNKSGYFLRVLLPILIFPVTIFDLIIGDFLNLKALYTRGLDKLLTEVITEKGEALIRKIFKNKNNSFEEIHMNNYDFFRIFSHYAYENSKQHQNKLINYVTLYGFLRAMTLISVFFFWLSIYYLIEGNDGISLIIILSIGLISNIFFMAFMKFYRRYTLEGLMIIAIDTEIDKKE